MNIDVELTRKQIAAYKVLTDYGNGVSDVLYGGAARGGKTWLGCFWQITRRLQFAGSVGMITRADFTDLNSTTLVTFWKVVKAMGLQGTITYKGGIDNYALFPNGSKIFFRWCKFLPKDPEFDRFGSYELTDFFGDEAQQYHPKFIAVIKARFSLLTGNNPDGTEWELKPKMLYGCNPSKGWIYSDFWKPYRDGNLPAWRCFIRAFGKDNPYVPPSYFENLKRADKVTQQRLLYGNFDYDDDPTALFDDYDALCDLFVNEHIQPNGIKSGAADIAGKGHDRFTAYSCNGNVYRLAINKPYSTGKSVEQDCKALIITDGIPRSMFVVDADGIGSYLESYLTGIKEFHGGAKPYDPKYRNLKAQCYYKLRDLVNRRAIRIIGMSPAEQEQLKEELQAVRIVGIDNDTGKFEINSKEEQKELLGRSPDLADPLAMSMIFRIRGTAGTKIHVGAPV